MRGSFKTPGCWEDEVSPDFRIGSGRTGSLNSLSLCLLLIAAEVGEGRQSPAKNGDSSFD